MSAINNLNMQDTVVKSSLVQSVQERDGDVNRAHLRAAEAFQEEVTRQAGEVVKNVPTAEQGGIRPDVGDRQNGGEKKKRGDRKQDATPEEARKNGWVMGVDDDGVPHTVNIVI